MSVDGMPSLIAKAKVRAKANRPNPDAKNAMAKPMCRGEFLPNTQAMRQSKKSWAMMMKATFVFK